MNNVSKKQKVQYLIKDQELELVSMQAKLKEELEWLGRDIKRILKALDGDLRYSEHFPINHMGEIQSRGSSIDNTIGRLYEIFNGVRNLRRIAELMEEKDEN